MRRSYAERDLWRDDPAKRLRRIERMVNLVYRFMVGITGGVGDAEAFPGFDEVGTIKMWGRSIDEIPHGWALCNGSNGTPNMTDRFIVGAGGSYSPGDTGGDDEVDISHVHGPGTLNTDSDSHTHDVTGSGGIGGDHSHGGDTGTYTTPDTTYSNEATGSDFTALDDGHTHTINASGTHTHSSGGYATDSDSHDHDVDTGQTATGGDTTHDNRPQFYAVVFIMRIY